MANDKNNINELVINDDDPTAELETLSLKKVLPETSSSQSEVAAKTHGFQKEADTDDSAAISALKYELAARSETIDRLQFDIEQLLLKCKGLETEYKAREEITNRQNSDLEAIRTKLANKNKLLKKRNLSIKALESEIRDHKSEYNKLQASIDDLAKAASESVGVDAGDERTFRETQAGQLASNRILIRELRAQIERTDSHADELRRKLQERTEIASHAVDNHDYLAAELAKANHKIGELEQAIESETDTTAELRVAIEKIKDAHAEEIRIIRFELGEAQETVAQHELVTEQLASDLVETRGYRNDLEQMLNQSEESNQCKLENLERENRKLRQSIDDLESKLETKSEAVNYFLGKLAKKTQQVESIGEIENVIHEIDDRVSEHIDEPIVSERDRVTRVLIGFVDGQELRFPLFKDRLTIGRTEQNDIQLRASYVSRRHAVIVTDGEKTRIIDWGSKNGVFVNSSRITEHFLSNGDTVTIGTADFHYEERPKRDS
ncbi:MAG: FHA domain-containing protein [Gammaproteobacteria bacterium]|nr:FHA domain-containing protein [Gammaproteobacteria bacterium]